MEKETHNCLLLSFFIWIIVLIIVVIKYPEQMDGGTGWILFGIQTGIIFLILIFDKILSHSRRENTEEFYEPLVYPKFMDRNITATSSPMYVQHQNITPPLYTTPPNSV